MGKANKITITNDKGRLSKEEIERLVQEAEKYKAEDDNHKARIDAKNSLENFCYCVKNNIRDEKRCSQLSDDEKKTVDTALQRAIDWLDQNQNAEKAEYEDKLKHLEEVCHPVMMKMHPGASGDMGADASAAAGMPGTGTGS